MLGDPVRHVPSVAGAVEAFFASRDLASGTCRTYRQTVDPPSKPQPVIGRSPASPPSW